MGLHESLIRAKNLKKSFHEISVLKGIDLEIFKGELVVFIGPSGCGKTTLLRCLNGLEIPDEGEIVVKGLQFSYRGFDSSKTALSRRMIELRSQMGMVFQSFNLFPHWTLLENVMNPPMIVKQQPLEEAKRNAESLLDKVGLFHHSSKYPSQLSGGQQQRGAIARSLGMAPSVMLYDEPTSALDPTLVDEVLKVMKQLKEEGLTQVVVTHEMSFARDVADRIFFLENGVLIESGPPNQIFSLPKDPRTRKFLEKFL